MLVLLGILIVLGAIALAHHNKLILEQQRQINGLIGRVHVLSCKDEQAAKISAQPTADDDIKAGCVTKCDGPEDMIAKLKNDQKP